MTKKTKRNIWVSVILTLILIATIAAVGGFSFRAGYQQGALFTEGAALEDGSTFLNPMVYGHGFYPRIHYGFPLFRIGGFFLSILFIFLLFGLVRRLFFPRSFGFHRRMPMHPGMWHGKYPWRWEDDEDWKAFMKHKYPDHPHFNQEKDQSEADEG